MDKYSSSSFGYTKEIPDYNMYLGEIIPQLILLQRAPPRPTNVEPHIHIAPSSWAPGYFPLTSIVLKIYKHEAIPINSFCHSTKI